MYRAGQGRDKEDNLLGYRIEVAQANWDDTNCIVVRFDVDKDDTQKAAVIESNYLVQSTVEFSGTLSAISTIETKTVEADFGEPITKTFAKTEKTYSIVSGNLPLAPDAEGAYNDSIVKTLVAAYKQADVERVEAKRNQAAAEAIASTPDNAAAAAMNSVIRNATASLI